MTVQFASDVEAVETDLPVTFIFNGKSYTGQKDETRDARDMQDAGYMQGYDFEVWARVEIFAGASVPAVNDAITIDGINYAINGKITSPDGVVVRMACRFQG